MQADTLLQRRFRSVTTVKLLPIFVVSTWTFSEQCLQSREHRAILLAPSIRHRQTVPSPRHPGVLGSGRSRPRAPLVPGMLNAEFVAPCVESAHLGCEEESLDHD